MLAEAVSIPESPSPRGTSALQVGDRCRITQPGDGSTQNGTIRFIGTTEFSQGEWLGVELDEPIGKNDGSVKGVQYFSCQPSHGVFVRAALVSKESGAASELECAGASSAGSHAAKKQPKAKPRPKSRKQKSSKASPDGLLTASPANLTTPEPLNPMKKSIALGDETMPVFSFREAVQAEPLSAEAMAVRRELDDAVKENDTDQILKLLPQAVQVGVPSGDIQRAQKLVNGDTQSAQKALFTQVEFVSNAVSDLAKAVQAAEVRAAEVQALMNRRLRAAEEQLSKAKSSAKGSEASKGSETATSSSSNGEATPEVTDRALFSRFLESFEKRVWVGLERRVDAAIKDAVARATQGLGGAKGVAKQPPETAADYNLENIVERALKEKGYEGTISTLTGLLGDQDAELRTAAVRALGRVAKPGHEGCIAALVPCVQKDADPGVRQSALRVLRKVAPKGHSVAAAVLAEPDRPLEKQDVVDQALEAKGYDGAVAALIQLFKDDDVEVRNAAVHTLGQVAKHGHESSIAALIGKLQEPREGGDVEPGVRQSATRALRKVAPEGHLAATLVLDKLDRPPQKGSPPDKPSLRSPARAVDGRAARDVKVYEGTISALIDLFKDEDARVRTAAVHALGRVAMLGHEGSTIALMQRVQRDSDPGVRDSALQVLREVSPEAYKAAAALRAKNDTSRFLVEIDRTDGASLGIKVYTPSSGSSDDGIRVKSIDPLGLFGKWNAANPTLAVCPGDDILQVNGMSGAALGSECQRQKLLRFTIARSGSTMATSSSEQQSLTARSGPAMAISSSEQQPLIVQLCEKYQPKQQPLRLQLCDKYQPRQQPLRLQLCDKYQPEQLLTVQLRDKFQTMPSF